MSLALARKYRPRNFASVAVQSHVANTLKGAIARDRIAHGYLLCGPRGTGKTTLARVLAMALNCERRGEAALNGEPCGECTACQRIWSGSTSLDVVELDAASNRGVDDARELRERAMYAPSGADSYKVYIVDEAHMLTRESWNTLLKILEEPPPRVVFVFATTSPQKIAQAAAPVLSRLQRFDLKRIGPSEIRERLSMVLHEEGVTYDDDALAMIARAADGGLRDALSLTDQVLALSETGRITVENVRESLGLIAEDEYIALLDIIIERRAADVFPAVQALADAGVDFGVIVEGLGDVLRAQLACTLGGTPNDVSDRMRLALAERTSRVASADLLRMLHALLELEPIFRRSGQPQLLIETYLVRCALLDRTVDLEDVLRGFPGGSGDDPPRRAARETRVASAHALAAPAPTTAPSAVVAPALPRADIAFVPTPRPATQQVAQAAAAQQVDAASRRTPESVQRPSMTPAPPPSLPAVQAAWTDVVDALRKAGRAMVAESLQRMAATDVTADGALVLEFTVSDDTFVRAVESARADVLTALQGRLEGVTAFTLRRRSDEVESPRSNKRLTQAEVHQQRLAQMTARDPVLSAAVRALDLELLD